MKNAVQSRLGFTSALVTPQCLCAGYSAQKQRGFTLIELLVVVLIIGILAAVALPQYQKAVRKARIVEYEVNLKALANAQKVYFLAHREYATDLSNLDIEVSSCKPIPGLMEDCSFKTDGNSVYVDDNNTPKFVYSLVETSQCGGKRPADLFVCTNMDTACKELGFTKEAAPGQGACGGRIRP